MCCGLDLFVDEYELLQFRYSHMSNKRVRFLTALMLETTTCFDFSRGYRWRPYAAIVRIMTESVTIGGFIVT